MCATPGCGTVLSQYNPGPDCSLHTREPDPSENPQRVSATKRQKEILTLIGDGALTVADLAKRLGISQQQTSVHLRALRADGRVERRMEPIPGQPSNFRGIYSVAVDLESLMAEAG